MTTREGKAVKTGTPVLPLPPHIRKRRPRSARGDGANRVVNPSTDGPLRPHSTSFIKPFVQYERESNAAYIPIPAETVLESEEVANEIVLVFGAEGRIVGLKVLDATRHLPPAALDSAAS